MGTPLRNPGCGYCIYSKICWNPKKKRKEVFCLEHAKIYTSPKRKRWRWVNCENGFLKNNKSYCEKFKRFGIFMLIRKFREKRYNKNFSEERPALKGDKYWKT